MALRSFLFAVVALVATAQTAEDKASTTTVVAYAIELPCNPVFPSCNGTWVCDDSIQIPAYFPEYGYLCENLQNVAQFPDTVLCPFGGVLTGNKCVYTVEPLGELGCPSSATLIDTQCVFYHKPMCPTNYVFVPERKGCVAVTRPYCLDFTATPRVIEKPSESPRVIEKPSDSPSESVTPTMTVRVIEKPSDFPSESVTPTMTVRVIEKPSESPRVIEKPSESPRVIEKPSDTPSESVTPTMTVRAVEKPSDSPRVIEKPSDTPSESVTPTMTVRAVEKPSESPRVIEKPSDTPSESVTPTMTVRAVEKPSESPRVIEKPSDTPSESVTPTMSVRAVEKPSESTRAIEKPSDTPSESVTPTMTVRAVEKPSESPRVIEEPSNTPSESMTPTMTVRVIEKPSESPRVIEEPSKTPIVVEKPSESPRCNLVCDNGLAPTYASVLNTYICIYNRYGAVANTTGYLTCPNGGDLWQKECIVYSPAYCPSPTPSPSPTCQMCPTGTIYEYSAITRKHECIERTDKVRISVCVEMDADGNCLNWGMALGCPTGFTEVNSLCERYTVPMDTNCVSASAIPPQPTKTVDVVVDKPSPSPVYVPSRPAPSQQQQQDPTGCGEWMCPKPFLLELLDAVTTSRQYTCIDKQRSIVKEVCVAADADGTCLRYETQSVCSDSTYELTDDGLCVKRVEPTWIACSPTPSPTVSAIKYVQGSLTLEIASNSSTNITAFEDPAVLTKIREAIGILMGVDPTRVVINNVQWISNGIFTALFQIPTGRRLVDITNGFVIDYTILDTSNLSGSSTESLSSANNVLSAALGTGVTIRGANPSGAEQSSSTVGSSIGTGATAGIVVVGLVLAAGMLAGGYAVKNNRDRRSMTTVKKIASKETYNPHIVIRAISAAAAETQKAQLTRSPSAKAVTEYTPTSTATMSTLSMPGSAKMSQIIPVSFSKNAITEESSRWTSVPNHLFKHKVEMPQTLSSMSPV
jgi:hypothetical protein